jgi:hypothetical protein
MDKSLAVPDQGELQHAESIIVLTEAHLDIKSRPDSKESETGDVARQEEQSQSESILQINAESMRIASKPILNGQPDEDASTERPSFQTPPENANAVDDTEEKRSPEEEQDSEESGSDYGEEGDDDDDELDETELLDSVPMMRRRNHTAQEDLDEIKQLIIAAERPSNYQRSRNKVLFGEDQVVQMAAKLYDKKLSVLELAEIPIDEKKHYVVRRTVRSYDRSKRKAPPLPKTPPPVKLRKPPTPMISPEKLLAKLLRIGNPKYEVQSRVSSAASSRSSVSIKMGLEKKGPYYQEPFEAAHLPYRLPTPVKRQIDNSFFAYDIPKPIEPKFDLSALQAKASIKKSPPATPKLVTKVVSLDSSVCKDTEEHTLFIERAKPISPRCINELDHREHIMPSNRCFVQYYRTHVEKISSPKTQIENKKEVPLIELPSLKLTLSSIKPAVVAGVDTVFRAKSARTRFRETYHRINQKSKLREYSLFM